MKDFQMIMYIVCAVMALGVIGIGAWLYKKRREDGD